MRRLCSVCDHPQRAEIDQAHIAGASIRDLAKRFGRNKDTIQKHVKHHIPAATQRAVAVAHARETDHGDSILAEVNDLRDEAKRLQAKAEAKRDIRTAIAAIRELVRLVELKARLLGELRDREINITNVQLDPETAMKMAQTYLARRAKRSVGAVSAGYLGAAAKTATISDGGSE
jgi:transposase